MKTTIKVEKEIEIKSIRVRLPVYHDDEEIPYDFPLRDGDWWSATIDIDTGRIIEWPEAMSGRLQIKVRDGGTYTLLDGFWNEIATLSDYVPNGVIPGEYGDYVDLNIDGGIITNWPKKPDVSAFFERD